MHKFAAAALAAAFLVHLTSCTTVQAVKPGGAVKTDIGYLAVVFTNKDEFIKFGTRLVFIELRQIDTGRLFYLPFGVGGELRLIAVPPGNYKIKDFVYLIGSGTIEGTDAQKEIPGVIPNSPLRPGTSMVSAAYSKSYLKEFPVKAGQIVYLGAYGFESKFAFTGSAVTVTKGSGRDDNVFYAIRDVYPNVPDSMQMVILPDEEPVAPKDRDTVTPEAEDTGTPIDPNPDAPQTE